MSHIWGSELGLHSRCFDAVPGRGVRFAVGLMQDVQSRFVLWDVSRGDQPLFDVS